ncbi:MAG: sugar transferase [Bacteroidetes bacterium]|nr:sugar transferase [Bacteroidota bacterium]
MYANFAKRIMDVFFALAGCVLLSWLFLIILFIYLILLKFPVLFTQKRIGRNNQLFTIYKFRTLNLSENSNLDNRRFWWGDVLRLFSLDELPQLWNVLLGEMSLIGPRPLPVEYLAVMNEQQRVRHKVRPGITGWTQVNGRHEISWEKKFELDEYYVKHLSFGLDVVILGKTVLLLFSFKKDKSLNEKKFEGTSS